MKSKKKIMIVDDDAAILDSISMLLEFEGYQVLTTSHTNDILNLENELPDLLLLDIWLSGTDGRDVCKKLKRNSATRDLPIVLISASREIEKSAKESGANDFLSKPFDADELLHIVQMHIG